MSTISAFFFPFKTSRLLLIIMYDENRDGNFTFIALVLPSSNRQLMENKFPFLISHLASLGLYCYWCQTPFLHGIYSSKPMLPLRSLLQSNQSLSQTLPIHPKLDQNKTDGCFPNHFCPDNPKKIPNRIGSSPFS